MGKLILKMLLLGLVNVYIGVNTTISTTVAPEPTPIVMWHGMGDSCCNPMSMGYVQKMFEKSIPGVYVHSLEIGDNVIQDTENGFFMNVNDQVELACAKVQADPKLQNGYHAIGFSQGGQFIRGLAQRCPHPPILNLISIGGPQQGVYGLPSCLGEDHTVCDYMRRLLNYGAYVGWIQRMLVQAQYWHDPLDDATYRQKSLWIADINNDKDVKNATYKDNLTKLTNLVLVRFTEDTVVDPRGSEWFSWYKPGDVTTMLPLNQTQLYIEDWIGLKELDTTGRLRLMEVVGNHLQMTEEAFDEIIEKYLKV